MDGICGALSTLEKKCSPYPGLVASRGRLVGTECGASQSWSFSVSLKRRYDSTTFHVEVGTPLLELPETLVPLEASKGSRQMENFGKFGVGSFRWRNQKRKEKGLQENLYFVPVEVGNLRHVLSVHPTSRILFFYTVRRSKPGGDERRTRALGHQPLTHR